MEHENRTTALVIACGALAREILALRRSGGLDHIALQCLPASLHNRPERIAAAVEAAILAARPRFRDIFVAYADCGTGGALDAVLRRHGVERIDGPHCYSFFAGADAFTALADAEPGTFYLTDFLARHFQRLVVQGLGLDRHPELLPVYFGNYRRLVYLAQVPDGPERTRLAQAARQAAELLGLRYEERHTGLGELGEQIIRFAARAPAATEPLELPCPN